MTPLCAACLYHNVPSSGVCDGSESRAVLSRLAVSRVGLVATSRVTVLTGVGDGHSTLPCSLQSLGWTAAAAAKAGTGGWRRRSIKELASILVVPRSVWSSGRGMVTTMVESSPSSLVSSCRHDSGLRTDSGNEGLVWSGSERRGRPVGVGVGAVLLAVGGEWEAVRAEL